MKWKSGLALGLIGGLTSSLLLTLVLVPVVYTKVDEWKETVPAFVMKLLKRPVKKKVEEPVHGGIVGAVEFEGK